MSFVQSMKDTAKKAKDAFTGDAAKVAIETAGVLTPGGTVMVTMTVTSTGNAITSRGAVVDMVGIASTDDHKSLMSKSGNLLSKHVGKHHSFDIVEDFEVKPGESKRVAGPFEVPKDLDTGLKWLIRGRVKVVGSDPQSQYQPFKA